MLSELAADHVNRRRNSEPLEGQAGYGVSGCPVEGPYVEIWTTLDGNKISRAAYRTHGCPSSVAASSVLCSVVTGRTVNQAKMLEARDLISIMGGIPEGKERFAAMAVEALAKALEGS